MERQVVITITAYVMRFNLFCERSAKRVIEIRFFAGMRYNRQVFAVRSVILDATDTIYENDYCGYQTMWVNIFLFKTKKQ